MPVDPESANDPFIHVHVCVHCWKVFRREEFEGRAHTTGINLCPKCGVEGPLNIEIRETKSLESYSEEKG